MKFVLGTLAAAIVVVVGIVLFQRRANAATISQAPGASVWNNLSALKPPSLSIASSPLAAKQAAATGTPATSFWNKSKTLSSLGFSANKG